MSSTGSGKSATHFTPVQDDDGTAPDFIYGGPFIQQPKPSPFLDTATPINLPLQGTFKKSFAYYSLKERMPVILTKIIDHLAKDGSKIKSTYSASDEDVKTVMQTVTKLKNDLMTNKYYDHMLADTPEAKKWNEWIDNLEDSKYFMNTWVWTECYIYRKIADGCEITKGLKNFDFFADQKNEQFQSSMEPICVVAENVVKMLAESTKDKRKQDFITLLKLGLWANKCDLSLTAGANVAPGETDASKSLIDPLQMIIDLKDKIIVDDSAKVYDQLITKSENMKKAVAGNTVFKQKCSCHRLAKLFKVPECHPYPVATETEPPGTKDGPPKTAAPETAPVAAAPPEPAPEPPKIPCPAKITVPSAVMFDIVCDNAGYELFCDVCLATFLISQKIVHKVRFHLKKYPWFVSDATPRDFQYLIDACKGASFSKSVPVEVKPQPAGAGGEAPAEAPPRVVAADAVKQLADIWQQHVDNGVFILCSDDYWTYPHVYKDMKKYDWYMYRKLQLATAILFKGDLNYRKLLGDRNCNPYAAFDPCLQGFNPAPVVAVRTVKADLICGMPKGKWEALTKLDEKWMQKGDYGLIQISPKAEALKPSDRPCPHYCDTCHGEICPERKDL